MRFLDLSSSQRIPLLLELGTSMGTMSDPWELLDATLATMRRAYGARGFVLLSTTGLPRGEYRVERFMTYEGKDLLPLVRERKGIPAPVRRDGFFREMVLGHSPKVCIELDLRTDPVMGDMLAPYHSAVAVPLMANELGMDWVVLMDIAPAAFNVESVEELLLRGNLMGSIVHNMETSRRLREATEHNRREMERIASIQRSLLPDRVPDIPGLAMAASYETFDTAGGDIYSFAELSQLPGNEADPRWAILIGDVSGHGPAAAVVMAMVNAIIRAYPRVPKGPGEVLGYVNKHLCNKNVEQSFVTAFLALYDPATMDFTYARAGHNPPMLKMFPHQGPPELLNAVGSLPLGLFPEVDFSDATIRLKRGQTLILYTDGITDATKPTGEVFGEEGIEHSLIECTGAPDCAIRHITEALLSHQLGSRPKDDQTIVAIQVVG